MKARTFVIFLFLCLFGIHAVLGNADDYDWPRWCGPNGDGIMMDIRDFSFPEGQFKLKQMYYELTGENIFMKTLKVVGKEKTLGTRATNLHKRCVQSLRVLSRSTATGFPATLRMVT